MTKGAYFIFVATAASLFMTACSAAPAELAATSPTDEIADLMDEGYSAAVSSCVVGLADSGISDSNRMALIESCEAASTLLNTEDRPPVEVVDDQPETYGDDPELDLLWDSCESGVGTDCDELWSLAPLGSEYEEFGITCGNRPEVLNCEDLRAEDD